MPPIGAIPGYTPFFAAGCTPLPQLHIRQFILQDKPALSDAASYIPWMLLGAIAVLSVAAWLDVRHSVRRDRQRSAEQLELRQQLARSEMKALRSQMNPHFIFNAINSIQHYVLTNEKDLANRYLVKFSRLMRNILELSKEELITLTEELDTARLYLEIESLRFNNAFEFAIGCEPGVDPSAIKLPPLIIQPFIENAIWHGLLLKEGSKKLDISVRRNGQGCEVLIDDNGIGRAQAGRFENRELKRKSFGMDLTRERLELFEKAHGLKINYDVKDKMEGGRPAGTTVIIHIGNKKNR